MESKDVIFTDITDTNMGVSVVMYVLMNNDEVLDGDALLSCIQVRMFFKNVILIIHLASSL